MLYEQKSQDVTAESESMWSGCNLVLWFWKDTMESQEHIKINHMNTCISDYTEQDIGQREIYILVLSVGVFTISSK